MRDVEGGGDSRLFRLFLISRNGLRRLGRIGRLASFEGGLGFFFFGSLTFLVAFFPLVSLLSRFCYTLFYHLAHSLTHAVVRSRCAPHYIHTYPLVQSALHMLQVCDLLSIIST